MDLFQISENQVTLNQPSTGTSPGFIWLDATQDEVAAHPQGWHDDVLRLTGVSLFELHLQDITNLLHPSYFDSTNDYEMLIFRKLTVNTTAKNSELSGTMQRNRMIPSVLHKIDSLPVAFFVLNKTLITVRPVQSRTIEAMRQRLLNFKCKVNGMNHGVRLPVSPEELMLRLLNAMVDHYLELRYPLSVELSRWQHALLDPHRPFRDWSTLLDCRIELHKLDQLCEEQHDAMLELRDYLIDAVDDAGVLLDVRFGILSGGQSDAPADAHSHDLLLVRIHDVIEHITRVLHHVRRLETSLESVVQIHFSAMAHRTSEIMRTLTIITALFMPLTLITGIFGMNFEHMPLLKDALGFWISIGGMVAIVVGLAVYFRRKHYLGDRNGD